MLATSLTAALPMGDWHLAPRFWVWFCASCGLIALAKGFRQTNRPDLPGCGGNLDRHGVEFSVELTDHKETQGFSEFTSLSSLLQQS